MYFYLQYIVCGRTTLSTGQRSAQSILKADTLLSGVGQERGLAYTGYQTLRWSLPGNNNHITPPCSSSPLLYNKKKCIGHHSAKIQFQYSRNGIYQPFIHFHSDLSDSPQLKFFINVDFGELLCNLFVYFVIMAALEKVQLCRTF